MSSIRAHICSFIALYSLTVPTIDCTAPSKSAMAISSSAVVPDDDVVVSLTPALPSLPSISPDKSMPWMRGTVDFPVVCVLDLAAITSAADFDTKLSS
ncbi:hypothetical protein PF005_g4405 [Phytophthora fragariae]|uniref:Secreted protein n=1 Tax=Phytophthora fragariae TaxID=53985 RepID=A0A6A3Z1C4_9STRA|nr:hypothetical protein PF010_g15406 [Phytophthora fragariae]KAE9130651.1 hypothetical protein PF007_g4438 [Phytophthora fragariae]KAE9136278.1 hypothetical protein PF006_g14424 [Phytophthora fragariae]KAE9218962.1 hypothetical protein PF004_g13733 [Phytophthora fragariae]KAE9228244.1 hypothetical protein PF005_g4405 [Phytophthora fragariae]